MNTHIRTSPATARTDRQPSAPAGNKMPIQPETVRKLGLTLTAGSLLWAASLFVYGPQATGVGGRVGDLTGLAFQIGVFALLAVQIHTRATGTSRAAAAMLKVELVLLGLASVWSLLHGVLPDGARESTPLLILDVFWPLSMLGMLVIGIKVATAGRWRGALRWWPLIAESWVLVTLPAMAAFGADMGGRVGGGHLIIGYAALGALLALRPHLACARDDA